MGVRGLMTDLIEKRITELGYTLYGPHLPITLSSRRWSTAGWPGPPPASTEERQGSPALGCSATASRWNRRAAPRKGVRAQPVGCGSREGSRGSWTGSNASSPCSGSPPWRAPRCSRRPLTGLSKLLRGVRRSGSAHPIGHRRRSPPRGGTRGAPGRRRPSPTRPSSRPGHPSRARAFRMARATSVRVGPSRCWSGTATSRRPGRWAVVEPPPTVADRGGGVYRPCGPCP